MAAVTIVLQEYNFVLKARVCIVRMANSIGVSGEVRILFNKYLLCVCS